MTEKQTTYPCPNCDYDLFALPEVGGALRCPECGITTDRNAIAAAIERRRRRPRAWLRMIGMIWNAGLAAIFAYWAYRIIPKILPQFLDVRWDLPSLLVTRTIYAGIEGLGFLVAIGLFLLSFSTLFWRPAHRRWRWFYGFAAFTLMLGRIIGAAIDWWDMGFVYIGRAFLLFVLVTSLPIILFGTGYLGLPGKVWHALRRMRRPRPERTAGG